MLIYLIIPWVLLSSLSSHTSVDLLLKNEVLSIREDSLLSVPVNRFIIDAIDSVDFGNVGGVTIKYSAVRRRYRLADTRCLSMCWLEETGVKLVFKSLNSDQLLFNECDSSIYFFGGDTERFSNLVKNEISSNFDPQFILEVLSLYVNTVNIHEPQIIVKSFDDFKALYNNPITFDPGPGIYRSDQRKEDLKAAKRWIGSLYYHLNGEAFEIEFNTWGLNSGIVTLWKFNVSRDNIELLVKETMVREIGPYLMRLGS